VVDKPLVKQDSALPTRKLTSGAIFGAIAILIGWADDEFWSNRMDSTQEQALVLILFAGAAYLTKNRKV